jgi:hypothetical protein
MEEKTPLRKKLTAALTFWRRRQPRPYAIYTHPDGRVKAVKMGYCWPALMLTALWLPLWFIADDWMRLWLLLLNFSPLAWPLVRRLWSHVVALGLVLFTALAAAFVGVRFAPPMYALYIELGLAVFILAMAAVVGRRINVWSAEKLLARHFTKQIELTATGEKAAQAQWEARRLKSAGRA